MADNFSSAVNAQRNPFATANTQCCNTAFVIIAQEAMHEGDQNTASRSTDSMPECDGSATGIDAIR